MGSVLWMLITPSNYGIVTFRPLSYWPLGLLKNLHGGLYHSLIPHHETVNVRHVPSLCTRVLRCRIFMIVLLHFHLATIGRPVVRVRLSSRHDRRTIRTLSPNRGCSGPVSVRSRWNRMVESVQIAAIQALDQRNGAFVASRERFQS
jgi:hypothetical protein